MSVPVSAQFNLFDWNSLAVTTGQGGVLTTSPTLLSQATTTGNSLVEQDHIIFAALGEAISQGISTCSSVFNTTVPDTYTFETEVLLTDDMPAGVSDLDYRVFLGIANRYGAGAGFLLTSKGVWLAKDITDSAPQFVQRSGDFITDNTGAPQRVVLRALVSANRVAVYLGAASDVYEQTTGSWWLSPNLSLLQNLPAKQCEQVDGVYIQLRAPSAATQTAKKLTNQQGLSAIFALYSIRLSSSLLVPLDRPTAQIDALRQVQTSRAAVLNGAASRDKYGAVLTYDWDLVQAPTGSLAKLQGATLASATTVVGVATNADFIAYARTASSSWNNYNLVVTAALDDQPLVISVVGKELRVQLKRVGGNTVTTAAGIYAAFRSETAVGFNKQAAELFTIELALPNTGDGVVLVVTAAFTGGTGSALVAPILIPDVAGPYTVGLRVISGAQRSVQVLSTITATATDELFGYRPNADYIFQYLPDFWNLVNDKAQLSSAWGAIAQVISGEMVQAWQHDYSKSIRDISRKHQRKWLGYSSLIEAPVGALVLAPATATGVLVDADTLAQPAVTFNGFTQAKLRVAGLYPAAPLLRNKALYRATFQNPCVVQIQGCTSSAAQTYDVSLTAVPILLPVASGTKGSFLSWTVGAPGVLTFTAPGIQLFGLVATDVLLRVSLQGVTTLLTVTAVSPTTGVITLDAGLAFGSVQQLGAVNIQWELLTKSFTGRLTTSRSIEFPAGTLLNTLDILQGDLVRVTFQSPYDGVGITVNTPIIAFDQTTLFVSWAPVIQVLNTLAIQNNGAQDWTEAILDSVTIVVTHFVRTQQTAVIQDIVSVPTLSSSTITADYQENVDYTVTSRAKFADMVSGSAVVTGATHFNITAPKTRGSIVEQVKNGTAILRVINGRNAGYYTLRNVVDTVYGTDQVMYDETQDVSVPVFTSYNPPPVLWWAETSYFDNWKAVENNFGLYVGLPKQLLLDATDRLDYTSVVKALCFAYMHGTSLDNVSLVAEAFSNIPFTEHRGQITTIVLPTTKAPGFLVMRDEYARDVTFTYPIGAVLANNPSTGRVINNFVLGANPKTLPLADQARLADSILPAYTRLFNVVKTSDYISDSLAIAQALPGSDIITKYHTFVVDVPLDITRNTDTFQLIKAHVKAIKPAHTKFILFGSISLFTDINIEDIFKVEVTAMLKDTFHSAQWSVVSPDPVVNAGGIPLLYPSDGLAQKVFADGAADITLDTLERYESGYQEGVLDDYSGDGSWNSKHKTVDQVNQLDFADTDVLASRVWLPILKHISGAQESLEFVVGEEVTMWDDAGEIADQLNDATDPYMWQHSPPVILHIGSGEHPKLGFGIYTPQVLHPCTYLLLGFNRPQVVGSFTDKTLLKTNYGSIKRLNGVKQASNIMTLAASANLRIKGKTSGATADPYVVVDITNGAHSKYFLLDKINRVDKLVENNLAACATAMLTFYIPLGGVTAGQIEAFSPIFDKDNVTYGALAQKYRKQLQQYPYDAAIADNQQFVPSMGPGLYLDWLDDVDAIPFTLAYTDAGPLLGAGKDIEAFTTVGGVAALENVHIGVQVQKNGDYHLTHGFLKLALPTPEILYVAATQNFGNITLRVEGVYFTAPDPGANPQASPPTYASLIGGSWVFIQDMAGNEAAAVLCTFESGLNVGQVVLGLDGAVQTSSGHILNAVLAPDTVPGNYYVVVRQYRNYKMKAGGATLLHTDTTVSSFTITIAGDPAEFGAGFGDAPFGGS